MVPVSTGRGNGRQKAVNYKFRSATDATFANIAGMQRRLLTHIGHYLAGAALVLSAIAWLGIPFAIGGRLFGLWPPLAALKIGFGTLVLAAAGGLVLGLAGLWFGRKREPGSTVFRHGLIAAIAALLILLFPAYWLVKARGVPPIHDITTDTANPPGFAAVLADRLAEHANSAVYDPAVAALQRAAYPDVQPLPVARSPGETFVKALAVAKAMGWKIDAAEAESGRIEATDTTRWIGFRDDIAVRVSATEDGKSRVDIRSLSRQGESDIGANAKRIRTYLARLRRDAG